MIIMIKKIMIIKKIYVGTYTYIKWWKSDNCTEKLQRFRSVKRQK